MATLPSKRNRQSPTIRPNSSPWIIDNGELSAYEEATFPSPSGLFAEPNLNDRILSCTQDTDAANDLSNPDNAINRFVAYHLLDGRMAYDRFVGHYNEYLYDFGTDRRARPQSVNFPTNDFGLQWRYGWRCLVSADRRVPVWLYSR